MIDGRRLKALRQEKKLSAEDLGAIVGVSRQQIMRYEASQTDATTDVLVKLAQFLGVSADYLLGLTNDRIEYSSRVPLTWNFDLSFLIKTLPPERLGRLLKSFDIPIRVTNDVIDLKALMDEYPPAYVAKLIKELGIDVKLKDSSAE